MTSVAQTKNSNDHPADKSLVDSLALAKTFFGTQHPLFSSFGIDVESVGKDRTTMVMPFAEKLCDHRHALHKGALVTLLDTNCGLAIFATLGSLKPIATIDLRVDFVAIVPPYQGVRTEVECISHGDGLAYVSGKALCQESGKLLATTSGSFAIGTIGPSFSKPTEGDA